MPLTFQELMNNLFGVLPLPYSQRLVWFLDLSVEVSWNCFDLLFGFLLDSSGSLAYCDWKSLVCFSTVLGLSWLPYVFCPIFFGGILLIQTRCGHQGNIFEGLLKMPCHLSINDSLLKISAYLLSSKAIVALSTFVEQNSLAALPIFLTSSFIILYQTNTTNHSHNIIYPISMASKTDPYASYAKAYKIHTIENSKYVWDVSASKKEENVLILFKPHGGDNQKFYLTPSNNGKWRINSLANGYCLRPDSIKSQSILYFGTTKGTPEEQWQLIELQPNTYQIKAHHGMVIDVPGGSYKDQVKPIAYPPHSGKNQQWVLQKI